MNDERIKSTPTTKETNISKVQIWSYIGPTFMDFIKMLRMLIPNELFLI